MITVWMMNDEGVGDVSNEEISFTIDNFPSPANHRCNQFLEASWVTTTP